MEMLIRIDKGEIYMFFKRRKAVKVSKYTKLITLVKSIVEIMKK